MRMIRSFLPVGQGAFYCEQFDNLLPNGEKVNVVYECGSSTDVELVKEQIRVTFDKDETIHAVFISHLHDDHINGLEYLLQFCNVKNIFFPLMYKEDKEMITLDNLVNGTGENSFINSFIDNPYTALFNLDLRNSRPNLYRIAYSEQLRDDSVFDDDIPIIASGENVWSYITPDNETKDKLDRWIYIPFNFRHTDRMAFLQKALFKEFGCIKNLQSFWTNSNVYTKDKIKEIYRKIPGGHNVNSMTLYSGPAQNRGYQLMYQNYLFSHCCQRYVKHAGCLYTGDYDASGKQKLECLRERYSKHWEYIGCLQIPHHGSKHNYNSYFSTLNSFFIISVGRSNRYRHPHSKVIKNLLFNYHYPFIVTEDGESAVHLVVDY